MNSRRSFLRSFGVAVMAVAIDVLPTFRDFDPYVRLIECLDALIAVFEKPIPPAFVYTAREQALMYGERAA